MNTLWSGVDRLLDAAADERGVAAHRLQLLAIPRWRQTGRPVPPAWVDEQRLMAGLSLALPDLLTHIREVVDGPIVLMKGPELATRYPNPPQRPFVDVDLLLPDVRSGRRALVGSGVLSVVGPPAEDPRHHHLPPLAVPGHPVNVELHSHILWVRWRGAPTIAELMDASVPSGTGLPGILALAPVHHAVTVAVHNWVHGPFFRAGHLLDIALLRERCDPAELQRTADRWGVGRIWDATSRAADALLLDGPRSLPLAILGRHTGRLEERSLAGLHLSRYAGTLWAPTLPETVASLTATAVQSIRPAPGDSWRAKLPRVARTLRTARQPLSDHHPPTADPSPADPSPERGGRLERW